MALDAVLADQLTLDGLSSAREGAKLSGVVDRNLVQGLGVVNTTLIQQHGSTADDEFEPRAPRAGAPKKTAATAATGAPAKSKKAAPAAAKPRKVAAPRKRKAAAR